MNNHAAILKGVGEQPDRAITLLPAHKTPNWPNGYMRVMVPFNEIELRNAKKGKTHHVQIVRAGRVVRT